MKTHRKKEKTNVQRKGPKEDMKLHCKVRKMDRSLSLVTMYEYDYERKSEREWKENC